ncbi:MAG: GNAT family N-acetyltransferase [Caulobacterales bacterium 68-7]|nr:N-acetyltransferase [Caulobacterales bacterium]OJU13953.1 MAG: GNAT family N-acetyltransferase [Caulobacterales bacterium 68-7]
MPFDQASPEIAFRPETVADAAAVEALVARAFGPGRLTRVSERVREFAPFRRELSMCAFADGLLIGSVRMWDVRIGGAPAIFLGPLAVEAAFRNSGAGGRLVAAACAAAEGAGAAAVLLVGDPPYFERFGFSVAEEIVLPGPVDRRRVMLRALSPAGEGLKGVVA